MSPVLFLWHKVLPIITSANVEPVGVIRSQLLVGAGLDNIDPLGDLELAGTI